MRMMLVQSLFEADVTRAIASLVLIDVSLLYFLKIKLVIYSFINVKCQITSEHSYTASSGLRAYRDNYKNKSVRAAC
jgi:hypothetical protein